MKTKTGFARFLCIVLGAGLFAGLAAAPAIGASATPDPATCLSQCKSDRLLCDRSDGHGLKCGQKDRACEDSCAGDAGTRTSPVASCEQRCEDSGQQCGIANNDAQACKSGRDACLARCKKK